MKYIFDTEDASVIGPIPDLAKPAQTVFRKTFAEMAQDTYLIDSFSTGLLPVHGSGLLSYRRAFNYEQLIVQLEPGINTVKWGNYENDPSAQLFSLAMPYRIIISDYKDNAFVGSRHFFSMQPIYDWDAPLYATGFSNTNNLGYGETSIGWICHYHNAAGNNIPDLAGKIDYAVWRESGLAEPYNYGNMSSTDGPSFYKKLMPNKNHFHRADNWAKKTKEEGLDWVFDESNFIRYHTIVTDAFYASSHISPPKDGSVDYTLRHASFNNYAPYYKQKQVKPINVTGIDVDKFTEFMRPKSGKDSITKYVPLNISEVHEFDIPAFTPEVKAHNDLLLNGIPCDNCQKPFPSKLHLNKVLFSVKYDDASQEYIPEIYVSYCNSCLEQHTVIRGINPNTPNQYHIACSGMIFDSYNDIYMFEHEAVCCANCNDLFYHGPEAKNCLVYGSNLELHVGCVSCFDSDTYKEESIFKKLVLNHYLTEVDMITCDTSTDPPFYALAKQLVHLYMKDSVCKCGIYIQDSTDLIQKENENEPPTCVSCVHKTLISLETITAVAIEQKEVI